MIRFGLIFLFCVMAHSAEEVELSVKNIYRRAVKPTDPEYNIRSFTQMPRQRGRRTHNALNLFGHTHASEHDMGHEILTSLSRIDDGETDTETIVSDVMAVLRRTGAARLISNGQAQLLEIEGELTGVVSQGGGLETEVAGLAHTIAQMLVYAGYRTSLATIFELRARGHLTK